MQHEQQAEKGGGVLKTFITGDRVTRKRNGGIDPVDRSIITKSGVELDRTRREILLQVE